MNAPLHMKAVIYQGRDVLVCRRLCRGTLGVSVSSLYAVTSTYAPYKTVQYVLDVCSQMFHCSPLLAPGLGQIMIPYDTDIIDSMEPTVA